MRLGGDSRRSGAHVRAGVEALALEHAAHSPRLAFDRLVERNHARAEERQKIVAAMPGKVVRVLVAAGDEVAAGQGIVVVEAMKMQNEMKAPRAGKVVSLTAAAGATVKAGDVLASIE